MGQIFSYLRRFLRPKAGNQTQIHDHLINYQTFYVDDIEEKHLDSHYINISDHFQAISGSSTGVLSNNDNNLDSSSAPHVILDLISENEEDDQVIPEVVLEKNVTTTVDYVSTVSRKKVRKLGPYTSAQRLLLVGEGDFSFSASLAVAFGTSALKIVATSFNSEDFLIKNYSKFPNNKAELETRGSTVLHDVDATKMVKHPVLGSLVFDRIIYNFPHTGKFGKNDADQRTHKNLVRGFMRNAKKMLKEDGEIHITSKSNGFFLQWDIPKIGSDQGLNLIKEVKFIRSKYPGYHTKFGFGGDKDFECNPSKTYKFALSHK